MMYFLHQKAQYNTYRGKITDILNRNHYLRFLLVVAFAGIPFLAPFRSFFGTGT